MEREDHSVHRWNFLYNLEFEKNNKTIEHNNETVHFKSATVIQDKIYKWFKYGDKQKQSQTVNHKINNKIFRTTAAWFHILLHNVDGQFQLRGDNFKINLNIKVYFNSMCRAIAHFLNGSLLLFVRN